MASTYRSTTVHAPSRGDSPHEELASLLKHLDGYGITLVSITVRSGVYETVVSGDIPSRELEHLNLVKVS